MRAHFLRTSSCSRRTRIASSTCSCVAFRSCSSFLRAFSWSERPFFSCSSVSSSYKCTSTVGRIEHIILFIASTCVHNACSHLVDVHLELRLEFARLIELLLELGDLLVGLLERLVHRLLVALRLPEALVQTRHLLAIWKSRKIMYE